MKVLFATDGSDCAQVALDSILEGSWPDQTAIMVVYVVPTISPYYIGFYYGYAAALSLVDETGRKQGQEILSKTVSQLKAGLPKVEVVSSLKSGNAAEEIIDTAKKWDADLIVMGSHGRSGLSRFFMGSVAESVLSRASCSVEVIRRHQSSVKIGASGAQVGAQ